MSYDNDDVWWIIRALGGIGILEPSDLPKLSTQRGQVLSLMCDGLWHSGPAICHVAGGSEGLRRLRELRTLRGVVIERRRVSNTRTWEYRLYCVPSGSSQTAFDWNKPAPVDERDAITSADYRRATEGY